MAFFAVLLKSLAYLSLPFFILRFIARSSPYARYRARVVLYGISLGVVSIWGISVAVVMSIAGRRFDVNWVFGRSFYFLASRTMDIKFVVEGEEYLDTKPAILVGNHQSALDIMYISRLVNSCR